MLERTAPSSRPSDGEIRLRDIQSVMASCMIWDPGPDGSSDPDPFQPEEAPRPKQGDDEAGEGRGDQDAS
jgi:hypothetical protein